MQRTEYERGESYPERASQGPAGREDVAQNAGYREGAIGKAQREQCLLLTQDQELCLNCVSSARLKTFIIHGTLGRVLRKVSSQEWALFSTRLSTALDPPHKS